MPSRHLTSASLLRAAPKAAVVALLSLAASACGGTIGGDPIRVTAVEPDVVTARGGHEVAVIGHGFKPGATVSIGTTDATVLEVAEDRIRIETPRLLAGRYDVTVTNSGGRSGSLAEGLLVEPLTLAFREAAPHYLPALEGVLVSSVAAGDVDGDGDQDLVLGVTNGPMRLLVNTGFGLFEEVDPEANDGGPSLPTWDQDTRQVILEDFDGDGALDLFACSGSGEPDRLLANDGWGHFTDASPIPFPPRVGSCLHAAASDLDGDGRADLVTVMGRAPLDATELVRVYRNESTAGALRFVRSDALEPPVNLDGAPYGSTYGPLVPYGITYGSDVAHVVQFTFTTGVAAHGLGAGRLAYDFAGVDGYVFYTIPVPGARMAPLGLRMAVYGDGSGHLLTLRVYDAGEERYLQEIGPVDWVGWQTVEATAIATWAFSSGDGNGVLDAPVAAVGLQLTRVAGGPESGSLRVDDVEILPGAGGAILVEDFETRVAAFQWLDRLSGVAAGDLDGDGLPDLALTASESATGEFLRILRNAPTPTSDGPALLGFEDVAEEALAAPEEPCAFPVLLDLESDGDQDLYLVYAGQDRALVNDGFLHLFDDTETLLPVDRVAGMHAAVGDLDLDGRPDIVIANHGAANRLYVNSPSGRLLDETPSLGLGQSPSRRVLLVDATGDGILDVLVVNDAPPVLELFVSTKEEP